MIPTKPHFIQPFLANYQPAIPISFFRHLSGVDCRKAVLRGRGGKLWDVEVNGRAFGEGWEVFVRDHDLQVGDVLLFGHEGGMLFHVVVFDQSTCQREYPAGVQVDFNTGKDIYLLLKLPRDRCGEIDLVDHQARTFPAKLWNNQPADQFFITNGWRNFCQENGFGEGDSITFKLIDKGYKIIFQICG